MGLQRENKIIIQIQGLVLVVENKRSKTLDFPVNSSYPLLVEKKEKKVFSLY